MSKVEHRYLAEPAEPEAAISTEVEATLEAAYDPLFDLFEQFPELEDIPLFKLLSNC
jgi:hypothetical protein